MLAAIAVLAACGRSAPPNVVVIVVDTLRADRLGALGNPRGLTPFIDSLAARGVVFHRAYTAAPWTQPSVASLFTSRFQSQHGIVHASSRLRPEETTLAEVLHEHGYATAGFSSNPLVAPSHGYGQGFDQLQPLGLMPGEGAGAKPRHHRADEVNARVRTWLQQLKSKPPAPVFLYVQYMEPHTPYGPPAAMLRRTFGDRTPPDLAEVTTSMQFGNWAPPDDARLREIADVYDAAVASVDEGIRALLAMLDAGGILDDAVVVVTADHGEGLREHGLVGHGGTLYEEVLRVPLVMLPPGGGTRVDVRTPVSLIDVAPTLLAAVGAPLPASFEGRSLAPYLWRAEHPWLAAAGLGPSLPAPRPIVSEHIVPAESGSARIKPHERAVVTEGAKLIVGVGGEREAFDLARDPAEQTALDEAESERLAGILRGFQDRFATTTHTTLPIDPALRDRLQALGYFE